MSATLFKEVGYSLSKLINEIGGKRFLAVECQPSVQPVFLKNGNEEAFHIRAGASSPALPGKQAHEYIPQHFK